MHSHYSLGDTFLRRVDPDHGIYTLVEIRAELLPNGVHNITYRLDKSISWFSLSELKAAFTENANA